MLIDLIVQGLKLACAAFAARRRGAVVSAPFHAVLGILGRIPRHRRAYVVPACTLLLAGCGTMKYTVDDGRPVNQTLLEHIRTLGRAEQALRPAVVASAKLEDAECDTQWELPFSVASSQSWSEEADRVAWVRALGVDERLTVIATTPGAGLVLGDHIVEIEGMRSNDADAMMKILIELRDGGEPVRIETAAGKEAVIHPVRVCRGHVLTAQPKYPEDQEYHWLMSTHPLEVFNQPLTVDEALWIVLWTQGLSEEAGARMKFYSYGKGLLTAFALFSVAGAVGASSHAAVATGGSHAAAEGAAGDGAAAAASAGTATGAVATATASQLVAKEVAGEVAVEAGQSVGKTIVAGMGADPDKRASQQMSKMMSESAANKSALSGVSWVAGTAFYKADKWAFERMNKLGADPLAAFTLHAKLAMQGTAHNAFVFDADRLAALKTVAGKLKREDRVARILGSSSMSGIYSGLMEEGVVVPAMPR